MDILKTKKNLDSFSNKKKELIEVIDFSSKHLSIKSSAFNFNESVLEEFENLYLFLKIKESISSLFNKKEINISENKAALHWEIRDSESELYKNLFLNVKQIKSSLKEHPIKNIVTLGIGGSYLGPKMLIESLLKSKDCKYNNIFISGSDNDEFYEKVYKLNQRETIFLLCSKSMETLEILNNYSLAKKWFSKNLEVSEIQDRFYAITSNRKKSLDLGLKNINIFNLNKDIGGRYSIWSQVSLTSIIESENFFVSFLAGGNYADIKIQSDKEYIDTIKKLSFIDLWNSNFLNINSRGILSYAWKLRLLPKYLQQLEMESLGKKINSDSIFKKTAQTIYEDYGPRAQHSFFQMLHQGTSNTSLDFLVVKDKSRENLIPETQASIQNELFNLPKDISENHKKLNSNISSSVYKFEDLSPFNLGFLIASWEHKTFIVSQLLEINPFDQFGVEEGKKRINNYFK